MEMIDAYSEELRDYIYKVDNEKRREVLLLVEKEIKNFVKKSPVDFYCSHHDEETWDKVENLICTRCFILNNMFQATDSEIKRFKTLNNLEKLKKLNQNPIRQQMCFPFLHYRGQRSPVST